MGREVPSSDVEVGGGKGGLRVNEALPTKGSVPPKWLPAHSAVTTPTTGCKAGSLLSGSQSCTAGKVPESSCVAGVQGEGSSKATATSSRSESARDAAFAAVFACRNVVSKLRPA